MVVDSKDASGPITGSSGGAPLTDLGDSRTFSCFFRHRWHIPSHLMDHGEQRCTSTPVFLLAALCYSPEEAFDVDSCNLVFYMDESKSSVSRYN